VENRRIISIDARQVARIFALQYGVFGVVSTIFLAVSGTPKISFPLGVVAPPFFLTFSVNFILPASQVGRAFAFMVLIACYTSIGWFTGLVLTSVFNLLAVRMGGIRVSFAGAAESSRVTSPESPATPEVS
jgi:hypothetical protein